ncbi:MAG: D-2-hydroxyacid dehydrogenase [Dehalococcoidia bacterium]
MAESLRIALMTRFDEESITAIKQVDRRISILDYGNVLRGTPPGEAEKHAILSSLADVEIMVGSNRLEVEYFDAAPNLRWFQAMNAGLERLDRQGLLQRGFAVTNGSGLAAPAIAEWCMGAMFALAKQFPAYLRNQEARRWEYVRGGIAIEGKTCGVVGLGAIGREVAKRARAMGMSVVASRRTVDGPDPDCDAVFPYSSLHALLAESDFVVLCVPLTRETHHLIDAAALRAMKPTASILNIARGDVIDQAALVAALNDGTIASAALDVTTPEPLPPDDPLWSMPNVFITPHASSASDRRAGTASALFLDNLQRYLSGQPLRNLARPELGY